jgi:hypothetical protein
LRLLGFEIDIGAVHKRNLACRVNVVKPFLLLCSIDAGAAGGGGVHAAARAQTAAPSAQGRQRFRRHRAAARRGLPNGAE